MPKFYKNTSCQRFGVPLDHSRLSRNRADLFRVHLAEERLQRERDLRDRFLLLPENTAEERRIKNEFVHQCNNCIADAQRFLQQILMTLEI